MASKRQLSGNIRQAHRSQPDLGQKKAELAKASKEELRHMEGRSAAKSAQQRKAKEADLGQKEASATQHHAGIFLRKSDNF